MWIRDGNFLYSMCLVDILIYDSLRTRFKYGGMRWMINYNKTLNNIYGSGCVGKDENWKTINWWKRAIQSHPNLKLKVATTSFIERHSNHFIRFSSLFIGQIIIVAIKV